MIALLVSLLFIPVIFPFSAWVVEKSFAAGDRFGRWFKSFHGTIFL